MDRRLGSMAGRVEEMVAAAQDAARHASLVHAVPWAERAAGGRAQGAPRKALLDLVLG